MNRTKRTAAVLLAVLSALCLAACGGSGGSFAKDDIAQTAPAEPMMVPEGETGWAIDGASDSAAVNPALADAKIIYTADMDLETREYDQTIAALDRLVEELGGYYESRSSYNYGTYRSADMTVRVPAEQYLNFCEKTGELAHRTHMSENTENVGEAYYDTEARLTTQRTKLERLQELLAQAESMEDIIALESALSETELQIEYLTGDLRRYDALIDFSTITVRLQEVYKLSSEEEVPMSFGQRLGSAFAAGLRRGIDGAEDLLITFARNWVAALVWIAVIAAVILVLRRRKIRLPIGKKQKRVENSEETKD